ncbi:MAG: hypothetical protein KF696_07650 [Planctomycetes bacterium]|nr:hypothetical protein [Planctomycetota bacterium]MCW8135426.1 hypothetical protein [Planctomycetota bacterium]
MNYGTPLTISFNVTGLTGNVTNVQVAFTGSHTWIGDLECILFAPNATQHLLFEYLESNLGAGGSDSQLGGTYTFNDAASQGFWSAALAAGGGAIPTGSYRAVQSGATTTTEVLTSLNTTFGGMSSAIANGTWTLRFRDGWTADTGSVTAATLTITTSGGGGSGPAVTINQGSTQSDPTSTSPIVFDVVFSESVTGFDGTDVSFAGSTAGGTLLASVTGTGANYTVSVTGMTTNGTVVASIPGGGATGVTSGLTNQASTSTDNSVTWQGGGGGTPVVTVAAGGTPSESGPTNGTFTLTATPAPSSPISVNVNFTGTATSGTDYTVTGATAGVVTIDTSGTATVTITPIDDSVGEATETVILTITTGTGYTVGTPASASLSILDNDGGLPGGGGGKKKSGGGGGGCDLGGTSALALLLALLALAGTRTLLRRE